MTTLTTTKTTTRRAEAGTLATAKAVGLFFAAPFIGLVYAVLLPFVGLGTLAWFAVKALAAHRAALAEGLKSAVKIAAAPFVGLAYVAALTLAGPVLLVVFALRALSPEPHAA